MTTTLQVPKAVYLDYNATTPCDPRVIGKMLPYFGDIYGNPANGLHWQGRTAARAVDEARAHVASLIGARAGEIVFTSGATESNNIAILGSARAPGRDRHRDEIVTCAVEHKAVLLPCRHLEGEGYKVIVLPVDANGRVSVEQARQAISDRTLLVSIQAANNEIGTLQPIQEIAEIARIRGALIHSDAAQAVGKVPVDVAAWGIDLLSASAHKLYGPKGIGCLYIRGGVHSIPLEPLAYGGGQERTLRPGTSNVPGIIGFGEACRICDDVLLDEADRLEKMRRRIEYLLKESLPHILINGSDAVRLPNTSSVTFPGIDADALLFNVPELMLGTGSACTTGAIAPSHVLEAVGLSREQANATVRLSLGRYTEYHMTDQIVGALQLAVARLWQQK